MGIIGVGRMGGVDVHWVLPRRWKGLEEFIIDFVGDEWGGKLSEILFESRGDGVDIKVGVRDVVVVTAFEAFFDGLDLGVAARFTVDTFDIHA